MYKTLKEKREQIASLRKKRDQIKTEKADVFNKALAINPQIDGVRTELDVLYKDRAGVTDSVEKLLVKRRGITNTINEKRKQINMMNSTKKSMFDTCRKKKAEAMEIDQQIMKLQGEIRHIQGRDQEW